MNIYISGPITKRSKKECERAFNIAKREIEKRGHFPVSPWDLGQLLPTNFEHDDYMAVDIEILTRCDAVLFLEGWENSEGCLAENVLTTNTKQHFYDINDIPRAVP